MINSFQKIQYNGYSIDLFIEYQYHLNSVLQILCFSRNEYGIVIDEHRRIICVWKPKELKPKL